METIFISIASYRDHELLPTLRDLLATAKNPDRLKIGVCWQYGEDESIAEFENDSRFHFIKVPYQQAKGACWARSLLQELYTGEKYYLQLDSHHRFTKHWDVTLIKMFKGLKKQGHKKPLITAYLPGYFPNNDPNGRQDDCWSLEFDRYMPEGPIFIKPHSIPNWKNLEAPVPSRFLSGHFIFTLGKWCEEVKYDPQYYFHGEEPSLAARSYTYGYDLFHPHFPIMWHEYTRSGKKKQWDDDAEWTKKNSISYSRYRALHGMGNVLEDSTTDLEKYGFGKTRTLEDYERYAGVKFATRQVHRHTSEYNPLPVPQENFDDNLLNKLKICIDIWKGALTEVDYDTFAVAVLNEDGSDAYRQDMDINEYKRLVDADPNDQFIHIWREYNDNKQPTHWRVWPHSLSKGWCDRIEQPIKYA